MNIQTAIRQMRIARRLGKLSNEQQNRIMRKISPRPAQSLWQSMRNMLESIKAEPTVKKELEAKRAAERDLFQIKCQPDTILPEEKVSSLSPLQQRLAESRQRCIAKQNAAANIPAPKKRGRKSNAEKARIAAEKAAAEAAEMELAIA